MALLIDDGVAGRGHRKSMTNGDFEMGGNYTGPHKVYETMTTQNFAGSFTKKEDFPPTDAEMNKSSIRAGAPQLPSEVSELDQAVFVETNRLRRDPKSFLPYLTKRLRYFRGNTVWMPGVKIGESTVEGPAAVKEAIECIKKMKPARELRWSSEIAKACQDHVFDQGPSGETGHAGTDGSDPW